MLLKRAVAIALIVALHLGAVPLPAYAAQEPTGQISGRADDEASTPYNDYTVRARLVSTGAITGSVVLDPTAHWVLTGLPLGTYIIELVKEGDVKCTEGPFTLNADHLLQPDVNIDCDKKVALLLLLLAGAAGITAGIIAASGSQ